MLVKIIVAAAVGILALAHTAPFAFLFDAASGELSKWSMPQGPGERSIYLTFDDGPNPTVTGELLDLLREKQVRATFFLIDKHATEETAPLIRRMFEEGHSVGQHTDNRWLMLYTPGRLVEELNAAASRVEQLAGSRPCPIFRPHAGWRGISMLMGLSRMQYKLVGWSWLNFDFVWFRKRTGDRIARQVLAHAAPGNIVVLHDGHHLDPRADRRYTLAAAARIIDGLRAEGYSFATFCGAS